MMEKQHSRFARLPLHGTVEGMETNTHESWLPIPGHEGYEVSDFGRVRSWHKLGMPPRGAAAWTRVADRPRILHGAKHRGQVRYIFNGERHTYESLVLLATGEEATPPLEDEEADGEDADWENDEEGPELTDYQIREVEQLEGIKAAEQVADEFGIDAARVRRIWDSTGA